MARILVVDDTAFMRLRLNNLLTEAGHEVLEAENGQQAVERYAEAKPDLVLMDITMPVMDGLTALEQIRSQYPEARVIMCTAMGQQALVLRALKAGAKDFIVKPFEPQRVLTAVQRVLGG
ncbi:MAG: response regulator [Bacillota bacterium]|nr:two-component system response regulator [Bacillota bacterium]REJ36053.1 MAG: two-component system response regulator [Bacillota bacterium]